MESAFTMHCITWQAGAPLLQEVREKASELGLINQSEAHADELDELFRHALALSKDGRAIGCGRITTDGRIERIIALPNEHREQVEATLIEVLNDFADQIGLVKAAIVDSKPEPRSGRRTV
ncbi:MAG: hypothetical protein WA635_13300 [Gallionella sp.]